jgi:hypothetical protein
VGFSYSYRFREEIFPSLNALPPRSTFEATWRRRSVRLSADHRLKSSEMGLKADIARYADDNQRRTAGGPRPVFQARRRHQNCYKVIVEVIAFHSQPTRRRTALHKDADGNRAHKSKKTLCLDFMAKALPKREIARVTAAIALCLGTRYSA